MDDHQKWLEKPYDDAARFDEAVQNALEILIADVTADDLCDAMHSPGVVEAFNMDPGLFHQKVFYALIKGFSDLANDMANEELYP